MQLYFISEHYTVVPALLRCALSLILKIQHRKDSTGPSKSRSKFSLKGTCWKGSSKQQGHHFIHGTSQEVFVSKEKCPLGVMSKNITMLIKLYVSSLGASHTLFYKKTHSSH